MFQALANYLTAGDQAAAQAELARITRLAPAELDLSTYWSWVAKVPPPTPTGRQAAILGYRLNSLGPWDPTTCQRGLPGSEECVVYASNKLVSRGWTVTVYMNPPTGSLWTSPYANPRYLPVEQYTEQTSMYDLVIMWRRYDFAVGRQRGKIVVGWYHDSPRPFPQGWRWDTGQVDGVFILSTHHQQQFIAAGPHTGFEKIPQVICGNGVVLKQFSQPMRATNPLSVGYFSNYARGLVQLINCWPTIRQHFPTATLHLAYGRQTWGLLDEYSLQQLVDKITALQTQGVVEHGLLGHQALAELMCTTSIWAYPCTTDTETFCITAVKAQLAGMIPVTTRIGALAETVEPSAPAAELTNYCTILLATLQRVSDQPAELTNAERQKYIAFARQFTWSRCVDRWLDFYRRHVGDN